MKCYLFLELSIIGNVLTVTAKYIGITGCATRKKSQIRTITSILLTSCPNHVINQLNANMVPTSDLV